jgi:hypothetical protein
MILSNYELQRALMPKPSTTKKKPPRISVGVSEAEFAEMQGFAEKHHVSMAWLGRQAIIEFLEKYRSESVQLPLRLRGDR